MKPGETTPPKFMVNPKQFYALWVPSLILALLVSAWRIAVGDNVPSWVKVVSYVLIGLAVGLPVARARIR